MGAQYNVQTVSMGASGEMLSNAFSLGRGQKASITFPVVTSGYFVLRGAIDTTSAASRRLLGSSPQNSGEIRLYAGVGSCTIPIPDEVIGATEHYRLESSVTQVGMPVFLVSVRL